MTSSENVVTFEIDPSHKAKLPRDSKGLEKLRKRVPSPYPTTIARLQCPSRLTGGHEGGRVHTASAPLRGRAPSPHPRSVFDFDTVDHHASRGLPAVFGPGLDAIKRDLTRADSHERLAPPAPAFARARTPSPRPIFPWASTSSLRDIPPLDIGPPALPLPRGFRWGTGCSIAGNGFPEPITIIRASSEDMSSEEEWVTDSDDQSPEDRGPDSGNQSEEEDRKPRSFWSKVKKYSCFR